MTDGGTDRIATAIAPSDDAKNHIIFWEEQSPSPDSSHSEGETASQQGRSQNFTLGAQKLSAKSAERGGD